VIIDAVESQVLEWLGASLDNAPVIVFLVVVAWDLRKQLLECIQLQETVFLDLVKRTINGKN